MLVRDLGSKAEAGAGAAARRRLEAMAAPLLIGRLELVVSASIGVALPAAQDSPDGMLRTADRMMYEAKAAGDGMYRLAHTCANGEFR